MKIPQPNFDIDCRKAAFVLRHYCSIIRRSYASILPYNTLVQGVILQETVSWRLVLYCIGSAWVKPVIPLSHWPASKSRYITNIANGGTTSPITASLPDSIIARQTILLKICITYRQCCQGLGQDTGQPTSWNGVFRDRSEKFRLESDRVNSRIRCFGGAKIKM